MRAKLVTVAEDQDGLVTWAQVSAAGMSRPAVDSMLRLGRWRRVLKGVYLVDAEAPVSEAPVSTRVLARAAVLRWGPDVAISHASAAELLGFPVLATPQAWTEAWGQPPDPPSPRLTVTLDPARRAAAPGIKFSRARLHELDVVRVGRLPVTSPSRTVFDMVRSAPLLAALAIADAGSHRNSDLLGVVEMALARIPRGRGVAHAREVLKLVAPETESPLETTLRLLLHLAGLPAPVPQHEVRTPDGTVTGRVDFAFPERGLILEADGRAHHETWSDGIRDRRRQNELVRAGLRVLRFTWDDVCNQPVEVTTTVREALHLPASGR